MKFLKIFLLLAFITSCELRITSYESFAQQSDDLEFNLDVNSSTVALPKIFRPAADLSGRGFHAQGCWPQTAAAPEVLDAWQKDIGFSGIYRLQYNLWEINHLAKDKDLQDKLLSNYEDILKKITDAGGIVILDIFSTPAGLGKVLDKKSPPWDFNAFKELVKTSIRTLSCQKKYNIWYEVWTAPDLDEFFLGRKQEYFNLYRMVAESIKELEEETKIHIPLGGPSVSWWSQNLNGNTAVTPERSLIYELIQFCYRNRLPLDFISWHGYSTDPAAEKELTIYNKIAPALIRDWLVYFNFDRNTPLIVDEWNYDRSANVLPDRQERSNVAASYIPSRIKNMYEAGINYQLYFSLEDFQNNSEGVVRNTGIFWLGPDAPAYKGGPKSMYNVFKMLSLLGNDMFSSSLKSNGEFVGVIATKSQEAIIILIYNYTDPDIVMGYLTKNIASLNNAERRILLNLVKTNKLQMLAQHKLDIATLRLSHRLKSLLKKATELNDKALKFSTEPRNLRINIKNLKENYLYQRYSICNQYCAFLPTEEKRLDAPDLYQETLTVSPYSVQIILLKKRPPEPEVVPEKPAEELKPEQPLPEKPAEQPAETPPAEKPIPQEPKHSETPKADSPS